MVLSQGQRAQEYFDSDKFDYYLRTNTDSAFILARADYTIAKEKGDSILIARAMVNLGSCYQNSENYDKALSLYFKAMAIFMKDSINEQLIVDTHYNLGNVYLDLVELETSKYHFLKAKQIRNITNYDSQYINISLANVYSTMENSDSAEYYYNLVLRDSLDKDVRLGVYLNLAADLSYNDKSSKA